MRREDLTLYKYLSGFCWDEYYFPMDGPFQNYTYFKRAGRNTILGCWEKTLGLIKKGIAPREVGLYVHWPFCPSECSYCFCSMSVPKSREIMNRYLRALKAEIAAFRDVFKGTALTSIWLGGGTPTFMPERDLEDLLGTIRSSFELEPGSQVYVESSPATLTSSKMRILRRHGVNRLTLGVQSRDEAVLKAVNRRGQTSAAVERAFELAASDGMLVDVDIMFGLEGQSKLSALRDVSWVLKRKPAVLHMFAFDPRPQTAFARQGKQRPEFVRRDLNLLMGIADRAVRAAGYRVSRLNAETLEPDCPEETQDSALRRKGASVLGLGASAISHAFGSAWTCHPLVSDFALDKAAPYLMMKSGLSEEMRGYALRHLSLFGRVSRRDFKKRFGIDPLRVPGLSAALRDLEYSGHLRADASALIYSGRDPVERKVVLKRLYSPTVLRALMRGRGADFRRYKKKQLGGNGAWPREIADKVEGRGLFRVYFRSS